MTRSRPQTGSAPVVSPGVATGSQSSPRTASARNVRGATGDAVRGSYCTPAYVASAVGPIDLDPFTNPRSHIVASLSCQLERGEDGFGSGAGPGAFLVRSEDRVVPTSSGISLVMHATPIGFTLLRATSRTRVWLQPDYVRDFTLRAVRHYLHTRFVALLRFDPRPEWADLIGGASSWIGVLSNSPGRSSFEFDAPTDANGRPLDGAGNTFPHALYARRYEDVTPAMRALCSFPDGTARHWRKRSALDSASAADWLARWGLDAAHFDLTSATTTT